MSRNATGGDSRENPDPAGHGQPSQGRLRAYAAEIGRGKMRWEDLSPEVREQVRKHAKGNGKAVFLRQDRERKDMQRKQAKEWAEAGLETYQPRQEVYTAAVRVHLDGCESGDYPAA